MMMVWRVLRISWHSVEATSSSPPTSRPNPRVSSTAQAVQLLSVTRATAAKRRPVVSQMTWRMADTALMRPMMAMSAVTAWVMRGGSDNDEGARKSSLAGLGAMGEKPWRTVWHLG
ncbi:hypothetical protein WR25_09704 [Diploscapter pachys]|uniref:Uncharacterized protein n=1 Tax=Diploscapter pachys TaxID=2018661 RepID=A0A2A2KKW0_9BILA|nr:hypothetical protein WR25_09704 [Diploscapter pachys]